MLKLCALRGRVGESSSERKKYRGNAVIMPSVGRCTVLNVYAVEDVALESMPVLRLTRATGESAGSFERVGVREAKS